MLLFFLELFGLMQRMSKANKIKSTFYNNYFLSFSLFHTLSYFIFYLFLYIFAIAFKFFSFLLNSFYLSVSFVYFLCFALFFFCFQFRTWMIVINKIASSFLVYIFGYSKIMLAFIFQIKLSSLQYFWMWFC